MYFQVKCLYPEYIIWYSFGRLDPKATMHAGYKIVLSAGWPRSSATSVGSQDRGLCFCCQPWHAGLHHHEEYRPLGIHDLFGHASAQCLTGTYLMMSWALLGLAKARSMGISHPGGHYWHYYPVSYCIVKGLQLIWRSGTHRFHLQVPDLQMSCRDLTTWQCSRIVAPVAMV